jgi:undecaprenyl-diphosphatase
MFAGVFTLWIIDGKIKKEQALHALFSAFLVFVICEMVKSLFPSLRPFQINGFAPLTLSVPGSSSFPSVHAAVSFAIATSIWLHNKKIGWGFAAMAMLVSLGRVLSNVHGPLDVGVGIILGVGTSLLIEKLHLKKLV